MSIAHYYAWRTRLYLVRGARVFELKRDGGVRFALVAALPPGSAAAPASVLLDVHAS